MKLILMMIGLAGAFWAGIAAEQSGYNTLPVLPTAWRKADQAQIQKEIGKRQVQKVFAMHEKGMDGMAKALADMTAQRNDWMKECTTLTGENAQLKVKLMALGGVPGVPPGNKTNTK
jgi:hypothetical protein